MTTDSNFWWAADTEPQPPAIVQTARWSVGVCAIDGCDNPVEALTEIANHGQIELFPELEPVICDGCQDVLADQYEAEFGWMKES